jgi:integrase
MAQPYLRRNRWYLKYKDAAGRWQDKVCDAKTKGQAVELQREVQVAEDRARHGLDQRPPKDGGGTVDELVEWWVESFLAKRASYAQCIGTIRKHIIGSKLGGRRLVDVRSGHVEAFLEEKAGDFSSETLNHLRGYLGRAFNVAIRTQRFTGSNPVSKVPKRKIPRKLPDYLRPEEVVPVLANVPSRWRCLFATALYTGMRKGELLGLRKEDVDLSARLITIRRSHDRDTTKGGHADAVPIAAELLPYLETAIAASATDLVFPGRDGHLLSRRVQLEQVLRRALRRANILTGYRHTCRRKGCGHVEHATDGAIRRCPKCAMKLWPVGQVRPIRFHHIRHTTASLLMMAGADLPAVQRIMRHTDPRITTEFYGHLAPGYLRNAIDRLAFEATPSQPTQRAAVACAAPPEPSPVAPVIPEFAAPLLHTRGSRDREPSDDSEKPPRFRCLPRSGREDSNLRHSAPKTSRKAFQLMRTLRKRRTSLEARMEFQSNRPSRWARNPRILLPGYYPLPGAERCGCLRGAGRCSSRAPGTSRARHPGLRRRPPRRTSGRCTAGRGAC